MTSLLLLKWVFKNPCSAFASLTVIVICDVDFAYFSPVSLVPIVNVFAPALCDLSSRLIPKLKRFVYFDLEKAMQDKKPFANYIVTQWLLNPKPISEFISKQSLPVHVGITGPLKISSLIKFANIVGAKNSINFLKSNVSKALDLLKPSDPNDLIEKIKGSTKNFHIYTFGGLKETNQWLAKNNYV